MKHAGDQAIQPQPAAAQQRPALTVQCAVNMANRPTADYQGTRQQLQHSTASKNVREPAKQLWLDAWVDPVAGVKAFSTCIHTCNLYGDGDWRLVVADSDKKIKV